MAETHTAHTEAPAGGHKTSFPPFEKDTFPSQLLWLAISFILLYALMARVALPRIASILAARQGHIEADLGQAQHLREQSEATLAAYEKALAEARGRAQQLAAETRNRSNTDAEAKRHALEAELNAKIADAERSIAATKTAAMSNVRGIAVEAAGAIVERLIGTAPAGAAVEQAVDAALKQ
jgi:F-type H+-transporting ATPase subunit b